MCKKNPEKQNLVEKLSGNNSEKALKSPGGGGGGRGGD